MSAEGLPFDRQERGIDDNHNNYDYDDGILAGEDFLSILIRSTIKRNYHHPLPTIIESTTDVEYNRETRSLPQQTEANTSLYETTISDNNNNDNNNNKNNSNNDKQSSDNSSVDRTSMQEDIVSTTQLQEEIVTTATSAEDLPSLIAESNKHSFGVEETEPITLRSDLLPIQFDDNNNNNNNDDGNGGGYPARVQPLPPNQFHHQSTSSFITQQFENNQDKIHHTLIFHDGPNSTGRARSVSYSTVIQALPTFNHHQSSEATKQDNKTNYPALATTTSTPTTTTTTTTERNWEQSPVVYNMPEQNYEIDESVSVMTNGRIHGVQTTPPPTTLPIIPTQQQQQQSNKNVSNNNKIGYVVQGRNYRKYRVEERTSDGFIVGEYGVVSNDDGTLRGVRYTADGTISRRLIQDALMKFLSL